MNGFAYGPEALPVTELPVSEYWREFKALPAAWENYLPSLFFSWSTCSWKRMLNSYYTGFAVHFRNWWLVTGILLFVWRLGCCYQVWRVPPATVWWILSSHRHVQSWCL